MKVRVPDIPVEGLAVDFEVDARHLARRIEQVEQARSGPGSVSGPHYEITASPQVNARLVREGSVVHFRADTDVTFKTVCSRCAEETETVVDVPIQLRLKPKSQRAVIGADDEELDFGIYEGEEIDCSDVAEEYIVLALPFTVLCNNNCRGLCAGCGANLNREPCRCKAAKEDIAEGPFSTLKSLKIQ